MEMLDNLINGKVVLARFILLIASDNVHHPVLHCFNKISLLHNKLAEGNEKFMDVSNFQYQAL